ncbi:MAG: Ig-like domain-containing protein [Pseudomonadota bacterium]
MIAAITVGGGTQTVGAGQAETDTELSVENGGTLNIENGGSVTITSDELAAVRIGNGSVGTVNLSASAAGGPARLVSQGTYGGIDVGTGAGGLGDLNVYGGGEVGAGYVFIGSGTSSSGAVVLDGGSMVVSGRYAAQPPAGSDEPFRTSLVVGNAASSLGILALQNGATLLVENDQTAATNRDGAEITVGLGGQGQLLVDGSSVSVINRGTPSGTNLTSFTGLRLETGSVTTIQGGADLTIAGANAGLRVGDSGDGLALLTIVNSTVLVDSQDFREFNNYTPDPELFQGSNVQIGGGTGAGVTGTLQINTFDALPGGAAQFIVDANAVEYGDYSTGQFSVGSGASTYTGAGFVTVSQGSLLKAVEIQVQGVGSVLRVEGTAIAEAVPAPDGDQGAFYRGIRANQGGAIEVVGPNATLTSTGVVNGNVYGVGRIRIARDEGTARIDVIDGAQANARRVEVARVSEGDGTPVGYLNVSGVGSTLTVSDEFGQALPQYRPTAGFVDGGRDGGRAIFTITDGGRIEVLNQRDDPLTTGVDEESANNDPAIVLGRGVGTAGYGYASMFIGRSSADAGATISTVELSLTGPADDTPGFDGSFGPFFALGRDGGAAVTTIASDGVLRLSGEEARVIVGEDESTAQSRLLVTNGGQLELLSQGGYQAGAYLTVGEGVGSDGRLEIGGADPGTGQVSTLRISTDNTTGFAGGVTVGSAGQGALLVTGGAAVEIDGADGRFPFVIIGYESGGTGSLVLNGGSSLAISGTNATDPAAAGILQVGRGGDGSLFLTDGASLTLPTANSLTVIGRLTGSYGYVFIDADGPDPTFEAGENLIIGADFDFDTGQILSDQGGTGVLVLANGPTVTAGTTTLGAGGGVTGDGTIQGDVVLDGGGIDGTALTITGNLDATTTGTLLLDASALLSGGGSTPGLDILGSAVISASVIEIDLFSTEVQPTSAVLLGAANGLEITDLTRDALWIDDIGSVPDEGAIVIDDEDAQALFVYNDGTNLVIETLDPGQPGVLDGAEIDFSEFSTDGLDIDLLNGTGVVTLIDSGTALGPGGGALLGITDVIGTIDGDTIRVLTTEAISVNGLLGNDTIVTGLGDNTITGGRGDDEIDGGGGTDTAVFSGVRADYEIGANPDGPGISVRDTNAADGDDGTDTIVNVEFLQFADVTIAATAPNGAPVADDEVFDILQGAALNVGAPGVLEGDTDPDGDALTVELATGPSNGSVDLAQTGAFSYLPDAAFTGTDSFTYRVLDGSGGVDIGTVTINIAAPPNQEPVANPDSFQVTAGAVLVVDAPGLIENDSDPDGDTLGIEVDTDPLNGVLELLAAPDTGAFRYTPNPGFTGTDSFTYLLSDGNGGIDVAQVDIEVLPVVNTAPTAVNDVFSVDEGETLTIAAPGILGNDIDAEDAVDTLTAEIAVGNGVNPGGTLVLNDDGSFSFTANQLDPGVIGGVVTYQYTVTDPGGLSDQGSIRFEVDAVNEAPVAGDDSYVTPFETALVVPATGVPGILDNDSDPDGDALSFIFNSTPQNGDFTPDPDGNGFTFIPDPGFSGTTTFFYALRDPLGLGDIGQITITVGDPPNQPPVAGDDVYSVALNGDLTVANAGGVGQNDSDPDGDGLSFTLLQDVSNGMLQFGNQGGFQYSPDFGFSGVDSFTYSVSDGRGGVDQATVTINVDIPNRAPVAVDDEFAVVSGGTLTIDAPGLLANDTDADGDTLQISSFGGAANGLALVGAAGGFTYTPDVGFVGVDSFRYFIRDGNGGTDEGLATVVVGAANRDPQGTDDAFTTEQDTVLTIDAPGLLANDSDPDGDALQVDAFGDPGNGTVDVGADGGFTYTPDPGFTGIDSFTYDLGDGEGGSDQVLVTVTVTAPNLDPVADDEIFAILQGAVLTVAAPGVLEGDIDPEGDPLTAELGTGPTNGTIDFAASGAFSYAPDADFIGTDSFTYLVRDGRGGVDEATVTISVELPPNRAPVATDDAFSVTAGETLVIAAPGLLVNDSDPDGDPLQARAGTQAPVNGTLDIAADGSLEYTPDPGFVGVETFDYVVADGSGGEDIGTVTVEVRPVVGAVDAVDDTLTILESEMVAGVNLLDNDLFTPGGDVEITGFSVGGDADAFRELSLVTSGAQVGALSVDPGPTFTGTVFVDYTLTDVTGTTDSARLSLTVNADPDAPLPEDDVFVIGADEVLDASLFVDNGNGADTDPNGDPFGVTGYDDGTIALGLPGSGGAIGSTVTLASGAELSIQNDGSIRYDPNGAFDDLAFGESATDSFEYFVTDLSNASASATASITVEGRGTLFGGDGNDDLDLAAALIGVTIDAGRGDDLITSGAGDDLLIGGAGSDFLRPGLGSDTIVFGDNIRPQTFGRNTVIGTADELDGDTITDYRSKDALGVLDDNGDLVEARLIFGGGELQVDIGGDGTIEATLFVDARLNGIGSSYMGLDPFDDGML